MGGEISASTAPNLALEHVEHDVSRPGAVDQQVGVLAGPSEIGGSAVGATFPKPVFPMYPGER